MTDLRQAAQQALEFLEGGSFVYPTQLATALREALAQPVQEPVTCRFCHSKKGCWAWLCYSCGEIDDVQQPAPPAPQRPWVGLTEDEKFEMAAAQYGWEDLLIAAEARLKEKNNV